MGFFEDFFEDMNNVRSQMNRIFSNVLPLDNRKYLTTGEGDVVLPSRMPIVDISEDDKSYKITAELPGYKKDDIKLKIKDNNIEISTETKKDKEEKTENWIKKERVYSQYYRLLKLPSNVVADKAKAKYKDGILEVVLDKTEDKTLTEIPIE